MKHLLLFLMTLPTVAGGQTLLVPNVHPNAKELKHALNKTKDTLLLESEHTISSVTLQSKEHRYYYPLKYKSFELGLNYVEPGKYTVIVITNRKIIVFNLIVA